MYTFVFPKLMRRHGKINKSDNRCDKIAQGISDYINSLHSNLN